MLGRSARLFVDCCRTIQSNLFSLVRFFFFYLVYCLSRRSGNVATSLFPGPGRPSAVSRGRERAIHQIRDNLHRERPVVSLSRCRQNVSSVNGYACFECLEGAKRHEKKEKGESSFIFGPILLSHARGAFPFGHFEIPHEHLGAYRSNPSAKGCGSEPNGTVPRATPAFLLALHSQIGDRVRVCENWASSYPSLFSSYLAIQLRLRCALSRRSPARSDR